jgi:membrane-bound lytic murein transglycosylase F
VGRFPRHLPAAICETVFFLAIVAAVFISALWDGPFGPKDRFYIRNWRKTSPYLEEILKKREITLITQNTSRSYYLYRDQAMGFEYDLAKAFADFIGVRLTVTLADDWPAMLSKLHETPTGFIAAGLPIISSRNDQARFSNTYLASWQHIIVHRDNRKIRRAEDLSGHSVHVRKDNGYQELLESLRDRNIDVKIVTMEDVGTEELIRMVSEKKIEITIADSYVALLSRRYYPQIVVGDAVFEESTRLGWAVDLQAEGLLEQINLFFRTIQANGRFKEFFDRYYADVENFDFVDLRAYHRRIGSRLPKYRSLIERAADAYGFDWRLIAAQMYQESHFNPRARSHAGAYGLMQLTKKTAKYYGVSDIFDPKENIEAGVRQLRYLYNYFDEAEGEDRIYMALAAYNIGQGHLMDARRLAADQQLDPNSWSDVSKTLPLLRQAKYYKQSVYGYCRGHEPVRYVKQIMLYYDILKYLGLPWVTTERDDVEMKG